MKRIRTILGYCEVVMSTIPIVIPTDVSTTLPATIPSVIHDSAVEVLIIPPRAPEARVTVVTMHAGVLDLITSSSTDSDLSEDPSAPEHTLSAPTTSLFLHSSDSFETSRDFADSGSLERPPPLDSHETTVPCRLAILVIPGQEIPFGRPYRTQPNGVLRLMTARRGGSSVALSTEDTIKESLEVGSETEIDLDIRADIEADIAAKAASDIEADTKVEAKIEIKGDGESEDNAYSSTRGTVEIGVDIVIQKLYDHMIEIPAQRIADIEEEHRAQKNNDNHSIWNDPKAIKELIAQRVGEALAAHEANRNLGPIIESKRENRDDKKMVTMEGMETMVTTMGMKDKAESELRDNRVPQQPFKRPDVARAYTAGSNEKKGYVGNQPYYNKCKLHHVGPCIVKCLNCKKVGHMARDCKNQAATNNQRALVSNQRTPVVGHMARDCKNQAATNNQRALVSNQRTPVLKNQNQGNQAATAEAQGRAFALSGGEVNKDSNIVT
nr:reverse transcriptase domain-containing protein [Tanacetum cinerariifolium]